MSPQRRQLTKRRELGKYFESEIRQSLRYHQDLSRGDLYWFRLWDWYDSARKIPPRRQPADFVMVRRGIPFLIECKSTIETSFPYEFVSEHQIDSLIQWERAGGKAMLLIKNRGIGLSSDRVYAVSITAFENYKRVDLVTGSRKSIRWEDLKRIGKELSELKKGIWRLSALWEEQTLARRF